MVEQTLEAPRFEQAGELTVRQVLGIDFVEPDGIDYLDAGIAIHKTPTSDGERFDVVIRHQSLNHEQLLGFLKEVSPRDNRYVSINGVIDDWAVIEDVELGGLFAARAERLIKMHEALGGAWQEFLRSRSALLDVAMRSRERGFEQARYLHGPRLRREDEIEGGLIARMFSSRESRSTDYIVQVLELSDVKDAEEVVLAALEREVNLKKTRHKHRITRRDTMERRLRNWHRTRVQAMVQDVLGQLPEEDRERVNTFLKRRLYDSLQDEQGNTYFYPRHLLEKPLQEYYRERFTKREGPYEGELVTLKDEDGVDGVALVPSSVRTVDSEPRVEPVISWVRNRDGQREFLFERRGIDNQYVDGVLGVLAVAYFSPEIRKQWPQDMGIRGSQKQFMGPAQVPVLALMRQAELLKSDFIMAVEAAGEGL